MWWHLRSGGRRIKGIFATQRIWDHPTSKTQSHTKRAEVERQSAPVLVTCYSRGAASIGRRTEYESDLKRKETASCQIMDDPMTIPHQVH